MQEINGEKVYLIDDVPTIIRHIRGNIAKGAILNPDFTLSQCYIVKHENLFAHGKTLKKAQDALSEKIFADMDTEERIEAFLKEFPDTDKEYDNAVFFSWHNKLTGSCEMGRRQFAAAHGLDPDRGSMTVRQFLELTKDSFGGEVIREVMERIEKQ